MLGKHKKIWQYSTLVFRTRSKLLMLSGWPAQLLIVFHETQIDVTGFLPRFLGKCLSIDSDKNFSKILDKHESSPIGLYDVGIVWPFPGFAIIIIFSDSADFLWC